MELRDYYERLASGDCEWGGVVFKKYIKVARLFQERLGSAHRFLDIGCGSGEVTVYLAQRLHAPEVYAVDFVSKLVEAARLKGVQAALCDLNHEKLPFEDGFFDAIFAGEVIEHLIDPDHLLQEIHRTLSDRGVAILTTPNLAAWFNRLILLLGWQPVDATVSTYRVVGRPSPLRFEIPGAYYLHLRAFTWRALREMLLANGFTILAVTGASPRAEAWSWRYRPLFAIDRLFSLFPSLAARLVVAVAKRG